MKSVMVTGVTGFLGSHFLINFIGRSIDHAYVLIRGADHGERLNKLRVALHAAAGSYITPVHLDELEKRVTIVPGDISSPGLGVDAADQRRLMEAGISDFWHFAASLNFEEYRREHIQSANMDGALNAINFTKSLGVPSFVYISTAYTCGATNGPIPEEFHTPDRAFSNFYEESKCSAEHIVREQCSKGDIALTVLRPSVVIGNSQTKRPGGSDTGLYGFIREISRLKTALAGNEERVRIFGMPNGEVNFIPVDVLMDDVRKIMDAGGIGRGEIYHLAYDTNPKTGRAIEILCEEFDFSNLALVEQAETEVSPLEQLLAKKTVFYSNYINAHKLFARKLGNSHEMTEDDFRGFVIEGIKAVQNKGLTTLLRRQQLATTDGAYLNVYSAGPTDGPAVLVANAVGMPVECLVPLMEDLAKTHHVMTWESRTLPSGYSNGAELAVDLNRHVQDALEVVDYLAKRPFTVVGWCTGARLALRLAKQATDRVVSVALLNGGYDIGLPRTVFEKNMWEFMPVIAADKRYASIYQQSIFNTKRDSEVSNEERSAREMTSSTLMATASPQFLHLASLPFRSADNLFLYARLVSAFVKEPPEADEFDIRVPVLVMTGDEDTTTNPYASEVVSQRISGARFVNMEGADHFGLSGHAGYRAEVCSFVKNSHQ